LRQSEKSDGYTKPYQSKKNNDLYIAQYQSARMLDWRGLQR